MQFGQVGEHLLAIGRFLLPLLRHNSQLSSIALELLSGKGTLGQRSFPPLAPGNRQFLTEVDELVGQPEIVQADDANAATMPGNAAFQNVQQPFQ